MNGAEDDRYGGCAARSIATMNGLAPTLTELPAEFTAWSMTMRSKQ
jgi:hypothetical protein